MHDDVRWGFGVPTPTMRWSDFSGLLHLIPVLKLKLSGYSSSFQPRAEVVRFVTLVNFPFEFYSKAFATVNTVSATVWYLLRTECRPTLHVARRMPDEKGEEGGGDGRGGGGGETDGQCGSTSFPNVLVRRTYFGRKTKLSVYSGPVGWQRLALKEEKHACSIN